MQYYCKTKLGAIPKPVQDLNLHIIERLAINTYIIVRMGWGRNTMQYTSHVHLVI